MVTNEEVGNVYQLPNNTQILNLIREIMKMSGETLEADNEMSFDTSEVFSQELIDQLKQRLEVGAERYGEQVPISLEDCEKSDRNNISEAIEEALDALVYFSAASIGLREIKNKGLNAKVNQAGVWIVFGLLKLKDAETTYNQQLKERK